MYNLDYYEKMLREYSATAEQICRIRWEWISEVKPKTVLDFGCGIGALRAFRPNGIIVDSYDIAPYPQSGFTQDSYDIICVFDVLEHLPNFELFESLLKKSKYAIVTVPVLPDGKELADWKHYKPGEHLRYFTEYRLDYHFRCLGFKNIKSGSPECPPREDILSALYERI